MVGTPIMQVCIRFGDNFATEKEAIVRHLLENSHALGTGKPNTWCPISVASLTCSADIIKLFLQNGVDADMQDDMGRKAVHLACYNSLGAQGFPIKTLVPRTRDIATYHGASKLSGILAAQDSAWRKRTGLCKVGEIGSKEVLHPTHEFWPKGHETDEEEDAEEDTQSIGDQESTAADKKPELFQGDSFDDEAETFTTAIGEKQSLTASTQPKTHGNIWAPTLRRNTPGWGLVAVFITLACCVGAIIIVVVSNGQNVEAWKVQPSVLLAILMAGSNATLMFALAGGVTNAWWYKVYKGATVAEVHQQFSFGMSLWEAMSAGRQMGTVACATIIGTWAIFATDPLMQRSTNVVTASITGSVGVVASIAPLIPYGYTGITTGLGEGDSDLSVVAPTIPAMDSARDYFNKVPITTGFTGCKGNCTGTVPAAGYAVTCQKRRFPVDYYAKGINLLRPVVPGPAARLQH
ncbi:hypothetical protein V491_01547 [Pseudogymnoascus sp. VKM F-3775]|nr:hypothetical protein V491_01547 [Pseudogymnoascus sp. VKM F-3775]